MDLNALNPFQYLIGRMLFYICSTVIAMIPAAYAFAGGLHFDPVTWDLSGVIHFKALTATLLSSLTAATGSSLSVWKIWGTK
jgi:hypothetical protein